MNDAELIKLAYSMSLGPHRFIELCEGLLNRLDSQPNKSHEAETTRACFRELESHFANALGLIESAGRQFDRFVSAEKALNSQVEPAALIDHSGLVLKANKAAVLELNFTEKQPVQASMLHHQDRLRFLKILENLDSHEFDKVIGIFNFPTATGNKEIKIGLTKTLDEKGQPIGYISALNVPWSPEIGHQFKRALNLTSAEISITQAVVTGESLNSLANRRNRSVNTIRTQVKSLLAKLALNSQSELACLYSGFAQLNKTKEPITELSNTGSSLQRSFNILKFEDGRMMDYEIVGCSSGRSALFLPALLGGNALTTEIVDLLKDLRIKLVIPWRPLFSKTSDDGADGNSAFERYSADLVELMDELNIASCPVIGNITSAMYAYALAGYAPDRVTGIVNVNGIVPTFNGDHKRFISGSEKLILFTARHAPKTARTLFRSLISRLDSGFDHETIRVYLRHSEIDLKTTQREDIKQTFREAYKQTTLQGCECFVREIMLSASDWHYLPKSVSCPVIALAGRENITYTAEMLEAYWGDQCQDVQVVDVEDAGHLLLYQRPDCVFDAVSSLLEHRQIA